MTSTHDNDVETAAEPVATELHDTSWSVNLEQPRYAADEELAIRDAIVAVEHTAPGTHVNLVTHADLGHPETFLYEALSDAFPTHDWEYVDQCGCGGHVTRVHVEA